MPDGIITPAMWHDHDSWHWFRQVTAPCNVACGSKIVTVNSASGSSLQCNIYIYICGSGMTWRWIRRWQHPAGPAMWHVALWSWHWISQLAATSNMTCHGIRPNVRHIVNLHLVSILTIYHRSRHVILDQSAKFYPSRTTLSRKKLRHVDFHDSGSQPSWILGYVNCFLGPSFWEHRLFASRRQALSCTVCELFNVK